jgi:hypothetical protein
MGRRKVDGTCHICGKQGPLSYEHVPPEAAFNDRAVVKANMGEWFTDEKWSGKGKKQQRGAGEYTLCGPCNSNTGSWYGHEYVDWARRGFQMLDRVPPGEFSAAGLVPVSFMRVKPLRFIKQAVTMIFSANSPQFGRKNPELVRFVSNKQARGLPPQYDVYMSLLRGSHSRMSGVGGILRFDKGDHIVLSEVAHPPFGVVMTFASPATRDYGRISYFADFDYDENRDVTVLMTTGEIYSPYPDDNRARSNFS